MSDEVVPDDFPRHMPQAAVPGAQPKLAVRIVDGRYTTELTALELRQRYALCADLVVQLLTYCERKALERPHWSREQLMAKVRTSLRAKAWGLSADEVAWMMAKVEAGSNAAGSAQRSARQANSPMTAPFSSADDIEEVLKHLGLGDRSGLASHHRAQDLQSYLLHREAVRLLQAEPGLVAKVEVTLSRWMGGADLHSQPLLKRWDAIVAARDWDAVLASSDEAQQLRQASPFAGLVPEEARLAIIRLVQELKRGS